MILDDDRRDVDHDDGEDVEDQVAPDDEHDDGAGAWQAGLRRLGFAARMPARTLN